MGNKQNVLSLVLSEAESEKENNGRKRKATSSSAAAAAASHRVLSIDQIIALLLDTNNDEATDLLTTATACYAAVSSNVYGSIKETAKI